MVSFRLSNVEKNALKEALDEFQGEVFLFGSRLLVNKKGGDIDILLKPSQNVNRYDLQRKIIHKFTRQLEQHLDVIVYDQKSLFCSEVLKYAQPLDPARL